MLQRLKDMCWKSCEEISVEAMSHKNTWPAVNACLLHKNGQKQIDNIWNCEQEKHENPNIKEDQMIVFINWFFGRIVDQLISDIQTLITRFEVINHLLVSLRKLFICLHQLIKSLLRSWLIIAADPHFWLLAVKLSCPLLVLMIIPRFPSWHDHHSFNEDSPP